MLAGALSPGKVTQARQVKWEKLDKDSENNLYFLWVVEVSRAYIDKQIPPKLAGNCKATSEVATQCCYLSH